MVLKPTFYIADFQSGDIYGTALPLHAVRLRSSLEPGSFSASLDVRKLGSMGAAHALLDLLKDGKCTLVPVLEGISNGENNPPTSRVLGEWWIARVDDSPPSPIVQIGGPEFAGYLAHVLVSSTRKGDLDAFEALRAFIGECFSTSQSVRWNPLQWYAGKKVPVEARVTTTDYWSAISELPTESAPFEWMLEAGLEMDGWSPRRVTRTLIVGEPVLARPRDEIVLELAAPGNVASLLAVSRSRDEAQSASTVYGWGAGSGKDQIGNGAVFTSRARAAGEPVKTRMITDPNAKTVPLLKKRTAQALATFTPESQEWDALMPTDRYTPLVGERYGFEMDSQWTRRAQSGMVRCVGWEWSSDGDDVYKLELVEV